MKVYDFGPFWGPIYCWKTKNIAKINIFCKNNILKISNNVSPRSQKDNKVLVKLNKKDWSPKLGLNGPHVQKGHQKFSHRAIIGPSIYTFWMPSFSFWVFAVLNFLQKKQILGFVHDPIGPILVGLGQQLR